ncbi:MAG: response regulator [Candidatus Omnitrophota bacterium]
MKNKILLVEYDPDMVDFIRSMFHPDIIDFVIAGDEREVRNELERQNFDLVITEALLPKSHGFTICKYVFDHFPLTRVIIVSDKLDDVSHRNEALQNGASEYIEKPLNKEKFMEKVLYYLNIKNKHQKFGTNEDTTNLYLFPYSDRPGEEMRRENRRDPVNIKID